MLALACIVLTHPKTQQPTAKQILERVQRAYDSVESFEQTAKAYDKAGPTEAPGGIGTAHIYFKRPNKLEITGSGRFNKSLYDPKPQRHDYALISDSRLTLVFDGTRRWTAEKGVLIGIGDVRAMSFGAANFVAEVLVHAPDSFTRMRGSFKVVQTSIGGRPFYQLRAGTESAIWIDARSYFLAKICFKSEGGSYYPHSDGASSLVVTYDPPTVNGPYPASMRTLMRKFLQHIF